MTSASSPAVRSHASTVPAFAGVAAVLAAFFVAAGAPTALLPIYQARWHFDPGLSTLAFGVYALGLLAALLTVGRLSDFLGRKPVVLVSVLVELASVALFLAAPSIDWVIAARVVQGIATGAATSALSAGVVELAPERHKRLGALFGTLAPLIGLGGGALFAGAVAQFDPAPTLTVWLVLAGVFVAGVVVAALVPETSARTQGARRSLVPRIAVPAAARHRFLSATPTQVAAWMIAALFMGLLPTVLRVVFGVTSALESGATVFIEPACAAVTVLLTGRVAARRLLLVSTVAIVVGAVLVVLGVLTRTLPLIWVGGVVGGAGFGGSFSGSVRLLTPLAHPHERASLFAAVYVVAYVAFGVPAIVAGEAAHVFGLATVTLAFGLITAAAAATGFAAEVRHGAD